VERDEFNERDTEKQAGVNSLHVLSSKLHFKINKLLQILTESETAYLNQDKSKDKTLRLQKAHLAELSNKLIYYFKDRRFDKRIKSRLDLGVTI
jgi:hypothetical protein